MKLSCQREGAERSLTVHHAYCLSRDQARLFACLKPASYDVTLLTVAQTGGWNKEKVFRKK